MIANLLIASLPAFIFIVLFALLDKKFTRKNWLTLLVLLLIGAVGSYVCYRFEMHFGSYFKKVKDSTYWEVLFYAIFGVAIFEEGYKWLITVGATFFDKHLRKYSVLIYSAFASIGFAWFENIVYFALKYGFWTSFTRMFTAFPSHICNAIWMGYFLTLYTKTKTKVKYLYLCLSLIFPIIIHGLYNSFLYGKDPVLMDYHMFYVVILYTITVRVISQIIKESK